MTSSEAIYRIQAPPGPGRPHDHRAGPGLERLTVDELKRAIRAFIVAVILCILFFVVVVYQPWR